MATEQLAGNLTQAILNQDDPETVRAGAPAYLLLIDGLIEGEPQDRDLLIAGTQLYATYATVFVTDTERAQRLAHKARDYARRALCQQRPAICANENETYDEFLKALGITTRADLPALYAYGTAWAGWIQTHSGDWNVLAELPKAEAVLERIIALDEDYRQGQTHLYLGIMRSQLPPAMGGHPEEGRAHFERAIALSAGRNLMAKVAFARHYARLVFDRELHDRLLQEVLEADPHEPGFTLSNSLAQREAQELLAASEEYFPE